MSVFAISDLHLPGGTNVNKSMAVFGARWHDHVNRIERNWRAAVTEADTVIIPGDISWGMTFDDAMDDFRFIHSLPGKKIIGKGNHDFWWQSLAKMNSRLSAEGIDSICFLQNNAFIAESLVIAGTRGWFFDASSQADIFDTDYKKIANREAMRLETSIKAALALSGGDTSSLRVFLHFPAVFGGDVCREILDVLLKYEITEIYFGHIHSPSASTSVDTSFGINSRLISADALCFSPVHII